MDYLTYIKQMTDDQFKRDMAKRGVYLQGLGTAGGLVGNYNADQSNREAANAGLNAAWQSGANTAAANAAAAGANSAANWGQVAGTIGGQWADYLKNKKKPAADGGGFQ
jgi:hypothetical protein